MWVVKLFYVLFVAGISARSIRNAEQGTEECTSCTTTSPAETGVRSASCSCKKNYFAHYQVKGCHPVYEEGNLDCPARYDCPASQRTNSEGCVFRGGHYDIGSTINISEPCRLCQCSGHDNSSYLSCITPECPEGLTGPLREGCHSVYDRKICCSVSTNCDPQKTPKCDWNGKKYYLGQKIYPEEDDCLVCICTEDWNGLNNQSCRKIDCLLEAEEEFLQRGCIPIYHEAACCPIEYHCPQNVEDGEERNNSSITEKDPDKCYFDGRAYHKGEVLDIGHPTGCVTCTCCTPPDFTCIHKSCPQRHASECHPIYKPGSCCPEYNCTTDNISEETETITVGPPLAESPCAGISCEKGEQCELKEICEESVCSIFPRCIPELKSECPTPQCDTGCYIIHIKDKCPTCACGNTSIYDVNEVCNLPNCTGSNCHLVSNKEGCPVCSCDPPCPVCPPGCQVQTDTLEGRCPECICNDVNYTNNVETTSCPEPVCHGVICNMKVGKDNCTQCVCMECLPPRCESNCKLIIDESAVCGKCECPTNESLHDNSTREVTTTTTTAAAATTTTPTTTAAATTAGSTETPQCPELICRGYNCRILTGADGCPFCTCESKCPPTKCIPGCFVDPNPLPDQCPGCICHVAALSTGAVSNES